MKQQKIRQLELKRLILVNKIKDHFTMKKILFAINYCKKYNIPINPLYQDMV